MTTIDILALLPQLAIAWLPLLSALPQLMKGVNGLTKGDDEEGGGSDAQMGALSSLMSAGTGIAGAMGGGAPKAVVDGGKGMGADSSDYLDETDQGLSSLDRYWAGRR